MATAVEAESLIHRLVGVKAARVEWIGDAISRVHVLSDGRRAARSLAREVEDLLAHQYGVRIRPEDINVVEVTGGLAGTAGRPKLVGCEWVREAQTVEVRCRLDDGGRVVEGVGRGHDAEQAAAQAALDAINQLTGGVLDLVLADLKRVETRRGPVVLAVVDTRDGEVLSGSSWSGDRDMVEVVCRAALDAVNRQLVRRQGSSREAGRDRSAS
jgi:hypothetical protein